MSSPKKLKLDVESARKLTLEGLNEQYFTDKEVENFLKILGILVEKEVIELEAYEKTDSEDGKFDIVATIAKKISQLLEGDIDSLNLPKAIIKTLKTLKALVGLIKYANDKDNVKGEKTA